MYRMENVDLLSALSLKIISLNTARFYSWPYTYSVWIFANWALNKREVDIHLLCKHLHAYTNEKECLEKLNESGNVPYSYES